MGREIVYPGCREIAYRGCEGRLWREIVYEVVVGI